jgi:Arc/MetJ-type ribon-helix-helix transcriptional regulator
MSVEHFAVPEGLQEFVLARVSEGGFRNIDDYVGELIRADHRQAAKSHLEAEVIKGIRSEKAALTDQDWADVRAEVIRRSEARNAPSN